MSGGTFREPDLDRLLQLDTLESLDLDNRTTDAWLARLSSLSSLKRLHIDAIHVTNRGLKDIAHLQNLAELDIRYAQVTDEGIKQLATLRNLKSLLLNFTQVTAKSASWLQRKLPDATIYGPFPSHEEENEIVQQLIKLGARSARLQWLGVPRIFVWTRCNR